MYLKLKANKMILILAASALLLLVLILMTEKRVRKLESNHNALVDRVMEVIYEVDSVNALQLHMKPGLYRNRNDSSDYVIVFDSLYNESDKSTTIGFYHRSQTETGGLEWVSLDEFRSNYVPV